MHLKKLGRYELVRVLGKGAMGVVYEARDPNLDRVVAIKTIMVDGLSGDAATEYEARFRVEARSAARLQHPNIVTVYDSGRDGDTAFLVMEFVQGEDLKQHLDRGERHGAREALHLVHDLLAALEFAHRQGIIHRDIKPANLLVESGGRLKLTDFGVARIAGEATRTQGSMIGTLKYMAPEQVQGQKVDSRADLYSAAVVTYQLLTGVRPFDGDNDFSIIHQVLGQMPAPPSTVAQGLPPALDEVMARALAKERDERYPTASELWQALRDVFTDVDLPALPPAQAQAPRPAAAPVAAPAVRSPTMPGGPSITHELELEYWRDVRDSTDPRELEGFLARFPEGIYADLARRRLERLAGPDDPDQTVLRGMTRVPVAQSSDPTLTDALRELAVAAQASAPPPPPAEPSSAPTPASPAAAAEASAPIQPAPAPRRPGARLGLALAGVALLAAAAVFVGLSGGAPEAPPAAAAAPAVTPPATAASDARADTAPVSPQAASAARTSAPPAAARIASPVPAPRRSAASAATVTAPPVTPQAAAASPTEPPRAEEAPAAQQASRAQRPVPPSETCKDKFFLAREFCLQSECAKPGYQNFPACIKLKEEAKLRDESRVRN